MTMSSLCCAVIRYYIEDIVWRLGGGGQRTAAEVKNIKFYLIINIAKAAGAVPAATSI